jgi:hypothetical protein
MMSVQGRFGAWRPATNARSNRIVRANGFCCHSDLCRKTTLELTGTGTALRDEVIDPLIGRIANGEVSPMSL